jgi:hypothetical protein
MQLYLQITVLAFSLIVLGFVWELIRYGQLNPAYALIWMIGAAVFFIFTLFSGLVHLIANFFEIAYAPTVVIGLALVFMIIMLLSQSVIISTMARNNRDLAQNIAILEWRVETLEKLETDTEISE